jgi:hypothetical protein
VVFVLRFADLYWLIAPDLAGHGAGLGLAPHLLDVTTFLAVGGLWLAFFVWQIKDRPLLPVGDPEIKELMEEAAVQ